MYPTRLATLCAFGLFLALPILWDAWAACTPLPQKAWTFSNLLRAWDREHWPWVRLLVVFVVVGGAALLLTHLFGEGPEPLPETKSAWHVHHGEGVKPPCVLPSPLCRLPR